MPYRKGSALCTVLFQNHFHILHKETYSHTVRVHYYGQHAWLNILTSLFVNNNTDLSFWWECNVHRYKTFERWTKDFEQVTGFQRKSIVWCCLYI